METSPTPSSPRAVLGSAGARAPCWCSHRQPHRLSFDQAACDWRLAASVTSVSSSTRSGADVRTPCASKCVRQATKPLSRSAVSSASNRGGSMRCARQRWATFQYNAGARASSCVHEGAQRREGFVCRLGGSAREEPAEMWRYLQNVEQWDHALVEVAGQMGSAQHRRVDVRAVEQRPTPAIKTGGVKKSLSLSRRRRVAGPAANARHVCRRWSVYEDTYHMGPTVRAPPGVLQTQPLGG